MTKNIPEVRFEYAWLLADAASVHLNEKWGNGEPLESYKYYSDIAQKYTKWWRPVGEEILRELCAITGLTFRQNIIDVYVAPWFYAFSAPMVLGVIFKNKDELVNVLTHEIIHRLLTDNTTYDHDYDLISVWREMFGDKVSKNTLVHIPVHAIMQELYINHLNRPDLLNLDKRTVAEYPDYVAAWEYVEEVGYDTIIAQLNAHRKTQK